MIELTKKEFNFVTGILWFWALIQGVSTSLSIIASILMMIFSGYMLIKHRKFLVTQKLPWLYRIFLLFSALMLVTLLINWFNMEEPTRGLSKLRYFLLPLLTLPWLYFLKIEEKFQKVFLYTLIILIISYFLATIAGLISRFFCFQVNHWKVACNNRNPGVTGIMQYAYETPLVFFTGIYLVSKFKQLINQKIFWTLIISLIFIFLGLITSNTRGGIIGLFFGLFLYLIFDWNNLKKTFFYFIVPAGALLITFNFMSESHFLQNNRFFEKAVEQSTDIRATLNKLSMVAFKNRPILGYGLLNPKHEYWGAEDKNTKFYLADTHNTFTQVLVDGGIFSFLTYLFFFALMIYRNLKSGQKNLKFFNIIWLSFLLMSSVHSMFVTGTGTAVLLLIFLIVNNWMLDNNFTRGIQKT